MTYAITRQRTRANTTHASWHTNPQLSIPGASGTAGDAQTNWEVRRGLFERSEFRSRPIGQALEGTLWFLPKGCGRHQMVLGPFAKTKGPRLQGRNPANILAFKPSPDNYDLPHRRIS